MDDIAKHLREHGLNALSVELSDVVGAISNIHVLGAEVEIIFGFDYDDEDYGHVTVLDSWNIEQRYARIHDSDYGPCNILHFDTIPERIQENKFIGEGITLKTSNFSPYFKTTDKATARNALWILPAVCF